MPISGCLVVVRPKKSTLAVPCSVAPGPSKKVPISLILLAVRPKIGTFFRWAKPEKKVPILSRMTAKNTDRFFRGWKAGRARGRKKIPRGPNDHQKHRNWCLFAGLKHQKHRNANLFPGLGAGGQAGGGGGEGTDFGPKNIEIGTLFPANWRQGRAGGGKR